MAGKVETIITGTAETQISRAKKDAPLDDFERIVGITPKQFAETTRSAAIGKCGVADCTLRIVCQDNEERKVYASESVFEDDYEHADRRVEATITCDKSGSGTPCEETIPETTDLIQEFFDEVTGFEERVEKAREKHMSPAKLEAEQIKEAAEKEAAEIIETASRGLAEIKPNMILNLRERFNLEQPQE